MLHKEGDDYHFVGLTTEQAVVYQWVAPVDPTWNFFTAMS